jgi:outer membrane protein OmpA-like peptidoglycan-associated protein
MRCEQNGNKIWLKRYKTNYYSTAKKILRLRDNNFIISLTQRDDMGADVIRLVKFDLHRNILYDKTISTNYSSALNDIKEYSNSLIIGVGYVKDRYNTDGLVMVLDNSLDMLCQEHFGGENYDVFNGVKILNNSNAIVVGGTTPKNIQSIKMWFAEVTPECKLVKIQDKKVKKAQKQISFSSQYKQYENLSYYDELVNLFKRDINSKKISISKDLSINFIDNSLLFNVAQYKLTNAQKRYLKQFSKKLIKFLKRHKNNIKEIEIIGHTSSRWGNSSSFSQKYLKNKNLSLKRAYSVSSFIFNNQDLETKKMLASLFKDSGYGFAKKITQNDKEDFKNSRRVVIKIIMKNNS